MSTTSHSADIDWIDNALPLSGNFAETREERRPGAAALAPAWHAALFVRVRSGRRSALRHGTLGVYTFEFQILGSGCCLRRSFTEDYREGSKLRCFLEQMHAVPDEQQEGMNPLQLRRALCSQIGKHFELLCVHVHHKRFLHIAAIRPLES